MIAKVFRLVGAAIAPLTALVLAAPAAISLSPWNPGLSEVTWIHFVIPLPFYFGLAAAPGFLYASWTDSTARLVASMRRWWVRSSLLVAIACSIGGIVGAYWMVLFVLPSFVSLAVSAFLLWRFEHEDSRSGSAA